MSSKSRYLLDRGDGVEEIFEVEDALACNHELLTLGWPALPAEPGTWYQRGTCDICGAALVEKKSGDKLKHIAFYRLIETCKKP